MLKIKNLSFKFNKKENYFFKNISIDFKAKNIHFIQGKNGSGKSTFFRLLQTDTNKNEELTGIFYLDREKYELTKNNNSKRNLINKIKIVPQAFDSMIADQFSFTQNLKLANISTYPTARKLPTYNFLPNFVEKFNINYDTPAYLLSGGQRQILAILMIVQKQTKILLLDEPTSALDEKNSLIIMTFLQNLTQSTNLTILIVCHDKKLIKQYSKNKYFCIQKDKNAEIRSIIQKPIDST